MTKAAIMRPSAAEEERLVHGFLDLVAERGWPRATLSGLADHAGVSLAEIRALFADRTAILEAYARLVDIDVLSRSVQSPSDSTREKLFDLLMERFDLLQRHRAAAGEIWQAARRDPMLAGRINAAAVRSLEWMLRAAGAADDGLLATVRAQALAVILGRVAETWLKDDDPGLARTMARLDKELRRAEQLAQGTDRVLSLFRRAADAAAGSRHPSDGDDGAPDAQSGSSAAEAPAEQSAHAGAPETAAEPGDDDDLPTIDEFEKSATRQQAPKPKTAATRKAAAKKTSAATAAKATTTRRKASTGRRTTPPKPPEN